MNRLQTITWFAGLFEGEGTFGFVRGNPRRLAIQMTDLDVLERVQENFGGKICHMTKREEHWKESWKWQISGSKSVELAKEIRPYLLARRQARCDEYIALYKTVEMQRGRQSDSKKAMIATVFEQRKQGLTHKQIADNLGVDRSYVSHTLAGKYGLPEEAV